MTAEVLSNLASKALESLAKLALQEAASCWGAQNDLKELENTIQMIQARVRDAERCQEENSDLIKLWLRRLKQVLYRADDLFDEVLTLDRLNQRKVRRKREKVGILFSWSGPLYWNIKLAHEIKSIRKELDAIKSDMDGLNLKAIHVQELQLPMDRLMKKRETSSFVKAEDVIGRENDKNMIIEMLFDPQYDRKRIMVISIVGFGGLGKTTLAQLVFNDKAVQKHFDLKKWVCVPEVNNLDAVMRRVYQSITGDMDSGRLLVDQIKSGIQKAINNKKYLLVLDDIWDDSRHSWLDLLRLLDCGQPGSRVIVTTRSTKVATAVGTAKVHNLGLLTKEESWNLFKRLAFESGKAHNPILTQIGKEIVDSCGNVPLAIRVVGSLLYSKHSEKEWQLIRNNAQLSTAKLMEDGNIMPLLKLSYDHLPPALKQCFAYCSLFPKDYEYSKDDLVQLWMAQGYFESSVGDIGDYCFTELLERNLFQDPQEDDEGNIKHCKMHDLVHDLAQHVAGDDIKHLDEPSVQITGGLAHVSINLLEADRWEAPSSFLRAENMRSLLLFGFKCGSVRGLKASSLEKMVLTFKSLRALDLKEMNINMIPSCIGRLRHLRYLNLAGNQNMKRLPDAITRLDNLQTFNLRGCSNLLKLPRDFAKLANLRHLVIDGSGLTDLPSGFGEMTSLQELDWFPVGKSCGIDSLSALNLEGDLYIVFYKWRCDAVLEAQRANLNSKHQLTSLTLSFCFGEEATPAYGEMDKMLMCLKLPPNLKNLQVNCCGRSSYYSIAEMPPRWFDGLFELVSITIRDCYNCRVLPHFSRLPRLKSLHLQSLVDLEYVENEDNIWDDGADGNCGSAHHNVYFPSLELLVLDNLYTLRGWTRPSKPSKVYAERRQLFLPHSLKVYKMDCPNLMALPLAQS